MCSEASTDVYNPMLIASSDIFKHLLHGNSHGLLFIYSVLFCVYSVFIIYSVLLFVNPG